MEKNEQERHKRIIQDAFLVSLDDGCLPGFFAGIAGSVLWAVTVYVPGLVESWHHPSARFVALNNSIAINCLACMAIVLAICYVYFWITDCRHFWKPVKRDYIYSESVHFKYTRAFFKVRVAGNVLGIMAGLIGGIIIGLAVIFAVAAVIYLAIVAVVMAAAAAVFILFVAIFIGD